MACNNLPRKKLRKPGHIPNKLDHLNKAEWLFLEAYFGKKAKFARSNIGLRIFIDIVKEQLRDYEGITTGLIDFLGEGQPDINTPSLGRLLRTCGKIIESVRSMTAQATFEDVVEDLHLFREFEGSTIEVESYKDKMSRLVFAVIGSSTLLYTATFTVTESGSPRPMEPGSSRPMEPKLIDVILMQPPQPTPFIPVADLPRRSVGAVVKSCGFVPITCQPSAGLPQEFPDLLVVAHLNIYTLTRLGDITVDWVNDLSKHCEFDRYSKEKSLKLFRLPSLCAEICQNRDEEPLIARLYQRDIYEEDCQLNPDRFVREYLTEVLLSYRLLFGQYSRSRRLFRDREQENAKWKGDLDPLLDALCSKESVGGLDGIEEFLRERNVYKAHISFPHLGPRLMELADFIANQRPRNLREVWDDQRDPERLITFKAVILIGSATIVLSILQLFVGVVQIAVSIRRP